MGPEKYVFLSVVSFHLDDYTVKYYTLTQDVRGSTMCLIAVSGGSGERC